MICLRLVTFFIFCIGLVPAQADSQITKSLMNLVVHDTLSFPKYFARDLCREAVFRLRNPLYPLSDGNALNRASFEKVQSFQADAERKVVAISEEQGRYLGTPYLRDLHFTILSKGPYQVSAGYPVATPRNFQTYMNVAWKVGLGQSSMGDSFLLVSIEPQTELEEPQVEFWKYGRDLFGPEEILEILERTSGLSLNRLRFKDPESTPIRDLFLPLIRWESDEENPLIVRDDEPSPFETGRQKGARNPYLILQPNSPYEDELVPVEQKLSVHGIEKRSLIVSSENQYHFILPLQNGRGRVHRDHARMLIHETRMYFLELRHCQTHSCL